MKIGVIIIFHNHEKEINIDLFTSNCNASKNIEFCLVNNDSKDDTYLILKEIKEACDNVSVVNIKKFKSDVSAVKSGARYMYNNFKLNHIGYVNLNLLNKRYQGLSSIILAIIDHQDSIIEYDKAILKKHTMKKTLFQKLFSVVDYLTKIKIESQVENIEYLGRLTKD
jgi:hypothetical protein